MICIVRRYPRATLPSTSPAQQQNVERRLFSFSATTSATTSPLHAKALTTPRSTTPPPFSTHFSPLKHGLDTPHFFGFVDGVVLGWVGVVPVPTQTPWQNSVCVQIAPFAHCPPAPSSYLPSTLHGLVAGLPVPTGAKDVAMHCPRQVTPWIGVLGQTSVGVQVEDGRQGALVPIVQGVTGGRTWL